MLAKTPHLAAPAEAEIRAAAVDEDLPHEHAAGGPDVDAVAAARVHVAVDVALDAVRGARVGVGEDAAVGKERLVARPEDGEGVDSRGAGVRARAVAVDVVRVSDVERVFVRSKGDAVGAAEAVGDDADVTRARVEAVDVLGQLRLGPEALLVAVDGVGEPDAAVRVDDDVVGRVEGSAVVVVEEGSSLVRALGFHVDETAGLAQRALCAEDETVAVVSPAVGHVVALGAADLVAGEVAWGEELDFGDDDGLVVSGDSVGRGVGNLIRGDEECVCRGVEDAGFVEVGGPRVGDEAGECRGRAEEVEEGIMVDEERAGLQGAGGEGSWRFPGKRCQLRWRM